MAVNGYTANLYSPISKLLLKSEHKNNIMVQSSKDDIILDCWIKTHDNWVSRVKFIQEIGSERAQFAEFSTKKDINKLHAELGHHHPCNQ